ncbi:MAG TPA: NAD(+) diphosphatase [Thermoanaerobaculia bacterium]|nr:NAD(+) diphosphatase [Thermoanaerobaculia bacterium]
MRRHLSYTGGDLDRGDRFRKLPEWIQERLAHPSTLIAAVWRDRHLIADSSVAHPLPQLPQSDLIFLGTRGDAAIFAADVSSLDEEEASALGTFVDLRTAVHSVTAADAALLAYARGILHWHRNHQYCGRCGAESRSERAGHMRVCTRCAYEMFPAISPAVIMLVERRLEDGTRVCLLARHGALAKGVWSTIAGFVEPGESLEETVAREAMEETGLRIGATVYRGSQPWPFPASLMIGFRAEAESHEITIDTDELEDARWFTAAQLDAFGDWESDAEYRLPRRDSIARLLIDEWRSEQ